jgi:uncharacterized protein YciI
MSDQEPQLWFTLEHSPGPAWRDELPWPKQDFAQHFAFQALLLERGLLIAAGPRPDAPGHGMMVIRAADADEAVRLATVEDGSVANGLLEVTVRPWLVVNRGCAEAVEEEAGRRRPAPRARAPA